MVEVGVHAATDVTGYGLLGHLGSMLRASSHESATALGARLDLANVPWLTGVRELAEAGLCPGGSRRNLQFAAPRSRFADHVPEAMQLLLADAQTSGGLLMAVPAERLSALLAALEGRGVAVRAVIGEVQVADEAGVITVA